MKLARKLTYLSIMLAASVTAGAADGTEWHGQPGTYPSIHVSVTEGKVLATTFDTNTVELQSVNQLLLDQFPDKYVDIRDFNRDGVTDIGVMEGSDLSGSTKCYQGYLFDADQQRFSSTPAATYCL